MLKISATFIVIYLLVASPVTTASRRGNKRRAINRANRFLDRLTDRIIRRTSSIPEESLDPLIIPNLHGATGFSSESMVVGGLSRIHRRGDSRIQLGADGRNMNITAELVVNDLSAVFKYRVDGLLSGEGAASIGRVLMEVNILTNDTATELLSFDVKGMEDYKVDRIDGATIFFNWILRLVSNWLLHNSEPEIKKALEREGRRALEYAVLTKLEQSNYHDHKKRDGQV